MRIIKKKPPRKFKPSKNIIIKDCANIYLNSNEQVTFLTKKKQEYDVCKKEWGFYATPSVNGRLKSYNFKTAIIQNIKTKKIYIFIFKKGKEKKFYRYLKEENCKVIKWLSK